MTAGETDGAAERRGRRWWWWIPVAAIALVVAILLVRGGGDEAEGPAGAAETPSLEPAQPAEGARGSVTIDGEDALPVLEDGDLSRHVGEDVVGTLVPVESVIADGVYWVGEERARFLVVEPEGREPPPAPGDLLTFTGTLRELDDDVRAAVSGAEAERTLERQGAYVDARDVTVEAP